MAKHTDLTDFDRVDDTEDRARFVRFLDSAFGIEAIRAMKGRSYKLLAASPGEHVLEVGCGTGDDARAIAEQVAPDGKVVGVDKSAEMIAEARTRSEKLELPLEFDVGDAMDLAFDPESFDACRIERTLIHTPDTQRAVQEMVRVLRPGGRIVAFEPDLETFVVDSPHRDVTDRILKFWCDGFQCAWIGRHLSALFAASGLTDIRVEPVPALFDFDFTNQLLIAGTLERAVDEGVVSEEESQTWLADLEKARDEGRFLAANLGFLVAGRKSGA